MADDSAAPSGDTWTTIESDPGVFTELIASMGVSGCQVDELWSLDVESLEALAPVYGLIFLFKWRKEESAPPPVQMDTDDANPSSSSDVFFANQVINNACATQAILSILLNRSDTLDLGQELGTLREFTKEFPPDLKGLAIGNSESIRHAHNSFARPEPFISDGTRSAREDDDLFHFISYVPVNGTLYELDGLKEGPIPLARNVTEKTWLAEVCPHIQKRIQASAAGEIRFNLMAVVQNRLDALANQVAEARAEYRGLSERLQVVVDESSPLLIDDVGGTAAAPSSSASTFEGDDDAARTALEQCTTRLGDLLEMRRAEVEKRDAWREENIRRRHNYVPFLFNFLKILAEKKQLKSLIDKARQTR